MGKGRNGSEKLPEGNDTLLARRIREMMRLRGFTLNYVSTKAGLHRSTMAKFLGRPNGTLRDPAVPKLAQVLRCDPAYLRGESDVIGSGEPPTKGAVHPPCQVDTYPEDDPLATADTDGGRNGTVWMQFGLELDLEMAARIIDMLARETGPDRRKREGDDTTDQNG